MTTSMTEPTTATVIQLHTRPGWLPFRWADARREYDHNIHRRMALIEDQAALAHAATDGDATEAHALLAAAGCRFTAEQVERLFDLSQIAADLQNGLGGRDFFYAADDYTDFLGHLAKVAAGSVTA